MDSKAPFEEFYMVACEAFANSKKPNTQIDNMSLLYTDNWKQDEILQSIHSL